MKKSEPDKNRRDFLKLGLLAGATMAIGGIATNKAFSKDKANEPGEKMKLLTPEGKLVEVDKAHIKESCCSNLTQDARIGIPGKRFVMVINLAHCAHALKCQGACNKFHNLNDQHKWLKVFKMQDASTTAPYWMPKPCFHCEKPPCVKVCPVDATYRRSDGIVLIDNERCIGCRFCISACPYSARVFNWDEPKQPSEHDAAAYSPETSLPRKKGTVEKCDFCPDMIKQGKLPHCVSACPNGVYYFGDINEDTVTNGNETLRFSQLINDKAGYRYLETLGTESNVYYLPPVNRQFPFEDAGKEDT